MMLNKAVFKPFIENIYFERNEKKNSNIILTNFKDELKLKIELMSANGLYVSHEYEIEDDDIEESAYLSLAISYDEFVKCFSQIKARSTIKLLFQENFILVKEHLNKKNEEPNVVVNMIKKSPVINNDMIKTVEMSDEMSIDTNDLKNIRYLSSLKFDIEAFEEFSGITLKKLDNDILLIGTSGSALHICKVKVGEIVDEMLEYCIPSTYLKNIENVTSEYGVYLSVGHNKNNNAVVRFSTDDTVLQFVTKEYNSSNSTIYNDSLNEPICFINKLTDKNQFTADFLKSKEKFKEFIELEKAARNRNGLGKLYTLLKISNHDGSNCYLGEMFANNLSIANYEINIENANDNNYVLCCHDLIKLLSDSNSYEVYFNENDEYFVLSNKNKHILIPKEKRAE